MLTLVKLLFWFGVCYVFSMTDTNVYISKNSFETELKAEELVPEVVQLIPYGKIRGRDGRRFQLFDIDKVIQNTIRRFNPSGEGVGLDLVLDYEHQTDLSAENGKPAPASGWIKKLLNKGNEGLWGVVEWTAEAKEFISRRAYRFLSPVFMHDKEGNITALLRAGLTNAPNLELKAFNTENLELWEDFNVLKTELCTLLGLQENATDEDVIAAVKTLAGANEETPKSLNKIAAASGAASTNTDDILLAINKMKSETVDAKAYAALNKEVEELKAERLNEKALTAVNSAVAAGNLPPALKDKALDMYKNLGAAYFESFVEALPKVAVNKETTQAVPEKKDKLSNEELAICKSMGVKTEDYLKTIRDEEV